MMPAPSIRRLRALLLAALSIALAGLLGTAACERHVDAVRRERVAGAGERVMASPRATPEARAALDAVLDDAETRPLTVTRCSTLVNRCLAILADGDVTAAEVAWLTRALEDAVALSEEQFAARYVGAR